MADPRDVIQPVAPVGGIRSVQPIEGTLEADRVAGVARDATRQRVSRGEPVAGQPDATTGGHLPATYAEFLMDADTQRVIIKIRDAATKEVLTEIPSPAVEAEDRSLRAYSEFLARHRATPQIPGRPG